MKKNLQKVMSLLCVSAISLSMIAGCGGNNAAPATDAPAEEASTETATEEAATEEALEEDDVEEAE